MYKRVKREMGEPPDLLDCCSRGGQLELQNLLGLRGEGQKAKEGYDLGVKGAREKGGGS